MLNLHLSVFVPYGMTSVWCHTMRFRYLAEIHSLLHSLICQIINLCIEWGSNALSPASPTRYCSVPIVVLLSFIYIPGGWDKGKNVCKFMEWSTDLKWYLSWVRFAKIIQVVFSLPFSPFLIRVYFNRPHKWRRNFQESINSERKGP